MQMDEQKREDRDPCAMLCETRQHCCNQHRAEQAVQQVVMISLIEEEILLSMNSLPGKIDENARAIQIRAATAPGGACVLISSRWRLMHSVLAAGAMLAAPTPRAGQIAPKRSAAVRIFTGCRQSAVWPGRTS